MQTLWSNRELKLLRSRYVVDGPKKVAEALGRTKASVVMKARHIGILPKTTNAKPYEWSEEMDQALRELYPTADRQTLVSRFALPNHVIRTRARRLGLVNLVRVQNMARTKSANNTSCNYRFFDQWSPDMAYVLGFLFADGSVNKRETDVIVAVAEKDISVLEFIKKATSCRRGFYYRESFVDNYGDNHQRSVWLTLSSKLLVIRLKELGLMPRKTYRDDPFPNVPDGMVPHFIRGYFDGDGSACVTSQGICRVAMVGTVSFVTGIRDVMVRMADVKPNRVCVERSENTSWGRITWAAKDCVQKFRDFVYPTDCSFFLARKREVIDKWLASKSIGENIP